MHVVAASVILALEMLGIVAFALSGVMVGVRHELDLIGVIVVGCVTALGGGVLRDLLLGVVPPMMFTDSRYAYAALITTVLAVAAGYAMKERFTPRIEKLNPVINVFDAVGLGIFVIVGVNAAMERGFYDNAFLALFIGVVTGCGGGLMRDQLVGAIPMVLQKHVYALAALAGAAVYYAMVHTSFPDWSSSLAGAGTVIAIRLLATRYRWNLPKIPIQK